MTEEQKRRSYRSAARTESLTQARTTPPTRADVARLAKVSGATVSYVLNDVQDARISEATKERVLQAAAKLGYVQDKFASSLRSGRSDLVLLPFFDWPYNQNSIAFLQELARHLDQMGYSVMLRFFEHLDKRAIARKIASFHPAGVIMIREEMSPADLHLLARNGVRAVVVYDGPTGDSVASLPIDFSPAGESVGQHLLSRGHREIAALVPRDRRILHLGLQRYDGLQRAAAGSDVVVERVDLDYDTGEAAALAARWKCGPRPTAVFTYNDEYGFLLMSALQDIGLDVPRDIALVGCDNLPLCELTRPRLTSVHTGTEEITETIAAYFDAMIQGRAPATPPDMRLPFKLVIRDSG